MRHAFVVWAFALAFAGSSAIAAAHTSATIPQMEYAGTSKVDAQALSPDVAEWTSHLIVTTRHASSRRHRPVCRIGC